MGIQCDLERARRAILYSASRLKDASPNELRRDMEKVRRELSPCDVVVPDIAADTPDERVRELLGICEHLAGRPPA